MIVDWQSLLTIVLGALTLLLGFGAANYGQKWAQFKAVMSAMSATSDEFAQLAKQVDIALADDKVTEEEFERIYMEFRDVRNQFMGLLDALKALFSP